MSRVCRPCRNHLPGVVEKTVPAVVNISTVRKVNAEFGNRFQGPTGPGDPFYEFFHRFFGDRITPDGAPAARPGDRLHNRSFRLDHHQPPRGGRARWTFW